MPIIKSMLAEKNRTRMFFILGLFLIFFIGLKAPFDPDFGWHLRNGWDILANHSAPRFDTYSFTMAGFSWGYCAWLADAFVAIIEKYFGLFTVSLFFAAISLAAFFIAAKAIKVKPIYQIAAALLATILSTSVIGVRAQVFSLLGLAILLFILLRWRANPETKIIYWLPILFLVWANVHPSFTLGLILFAIFLFSELFKAFNNFKKISIFFLISVAATFLNPFGLGIWQEVWRTATDFFGRSQIIEWQPLFATPAIVFAPTLIFATLLFFSLFFLKKRVFFLIFSAALFFTLTLLAWRNLSLFLIISSPLVVSVIENFAGKQFIKIVKLPVILILLFLITFYAGWQNIKKAWALDASPQKLAQEADFPFGAVEFLKNNPELLKESNLFNEYNWGGYLLWQLPEIKVFIDGRMPHWKLPDRHIFSDYQTIQAAKSSKLVNDLIKKYDLNLALVRSKSSIALHLAISDWEKIYEDELAVILKK